MSASMISTETTLTLDSLTPTSLRTSLASQGYVIVKSILSPAQLSSLRSACGEVTAEARTGHWPHVRVLPKQFPPWDVSLAVENGIWGVQHLMHPDIANSRSISSSPARVKDNHQLFAGLYFSEAILSITKDILECEDDELVMELLNLLVRPDKVDFELSWHRDDIPLSTPDARVLEVLSRPQHHTQYNLPLYRDSSLVVVPRSHLRHQTPAEHAILSGNAHAPSLPGQLAVALEPGDIVFYNNNILHRGVYSADRERMTLHGSVSNVKGVDGRARNVLQHGVGKWIGGFDVEALRDGGLSEGEVRRARGMKERLLAMGEWSGNVGYSLAG